MITPLPIPPSTADSANFNSRANTFLGALPLFATQANSLATEVNGYASSASTSASTATTASNNADAQLALIYAASNYKGNWSALTGALNKPASVSHGGTFWVLQNNLANVTTYTPGVSANWVPVIMGSIPQTIKNIAYTFALTDAGTHILHPSSDTTARTFTVPANASVAFPIGSVLTIINQASAGIVTISITSDTMRWSPSGTTGSRFLAANGIATLVKLTATEWIINGMGLT